MKIPPPFQPKFTNGDEDTEYIDNAFLKMKPSLGVDIEEDDEDEETRSSNSSNGKNTDAGCNIWKDFSYYKSEN
jgi:hypothetical protein